MMKRRLLVNTLGLLSLISTLIGCKELLGSGPRWKPFLFKVAGAPPINSHNGNWEVDVVSVKLDGETISYWVKIPFDTVFRIQPGNATWPVCAGKDVSHFMISVKANCKDHSFIMNESEAYVCGTTVDSHNNLPNQFGYFSMTPLAPGQTLEGQYGDTFKYCGWLARNLP